MMIVDRLEGVRARLNVLQHPFYVRWTRGELSRGELREYASQYRHLVVALADLSATAADHAPSSEAAMLGAHAREEADHVAMWERFGEALGARASVPLETTGRCVQAWKRPGSFAEQLAVLYAVEASQPEISKTKLAGLAEHYGLREDDSGCEYFREHAVRDIAHANQARSLIGRHVDEGDAAAAAAMIAAATSALEGNWLMLSGVEQACAGPLEA